MKAKEELKEFRNLSAEEINQRIASARQEMMNIRFRKASGEGAKSAQVAVLRRRIARLSTVLSESALAASQEVAG